MYGLVNLRCRAYFIKYNVAKHVWVQEIFYAANEKSNKSVELINECLLRKKWRKIHTLHLKVNKMYIKYQFQLKLKKIYAFMKNYENLFLLTRLLLRIVRASPKECLSIYSLDVNVDDQLFMKDISEKFDPETKKSKNQFSLTVII